MFAAGLAFDWRATFAAFCCACRCRAGAVTSLEEVFRRLRFCALRFLAALPSHQPEMGKLCTSPEEVSRHLKLHGFACAPAPVPDEVLDALRSRMAELADFGESASEQRVRITGHNNIKYQEFWEALLCLIEPGNMFSDAMDLMYGVAAWWADSAHGGEYIRAHAESGSGTLWHSDWHCGEPHASVYCVSLFPHDVSEAQAPLQLISESTGGVFTCTGSRGMMLVRNVDAIHRGTFNATSDDRAQPGFRFFVPSALRKGYRPRQTILSRDFDRLPPLAQMRLSFLRQDC